MSEAAERKNYKNVIGIDFGTTNTYITFSPYGTRNKSPLHLDGKTPAVDTAVLYSDAPDYDPPVFPLIGEKATITYGNADDDEIKRLGYRYYSNFKVEITKNPSARARAVDFLAALIRDAALNFTPLEPDENRVIIGAPSEAGQAYRTTLVEVAAEAGLGQVEVMDEPVGALLSDLGSHRFPLSDVLEGYLVIDFGGGTCDFAFLKKGRVTRSWGEMDLGGRLFDDLFFQWFCEQNPGALNELRKMGRDFYVWSYLCRRLKEDFSETMNRDPKAVVKADVGRFGTISNLTRGEFLERAAGYRLSDSYIEYYARLGAPISGKLKAGKVDLTAWFRDSLLSGVEGLGDIWAVSLAGGSSRWFFVKELCLESLKLDKSRILNSFNPYGAISEGLAILPGVQAEFEGIKREISLQRSGFVDNEIKGGVRESLSRANQALVSKMLSELYDDRVAPALRSYQDKRVAIDQLEADVSAIIADYGSEMGKAVEAALGGEVEVLRRVARERLKAWLSTFGLKLSERFEPESAEGGALALDNLMVGDSLVHPLILAASGLVSVATSTILASLFGGAGIAMVAHGPIGLVAGVIGGVLLSGAGLIYGQDWLKKRFKERPLPAMLMRLIASEAMSKKIRGDFEAKLSEQLEILGKDFEMRLGQAMTLMIDTEIDNLGIVNIF